MQSLREIYKTGKGPSSSHTMGPERAIKIIRGLYPEADALKVTLYGSLALTGKGAGWWLLCVCAWLAVMAGELLNSALEEAFNLITTEYSPGVKAGKDMASAAVFVLMLANAGVWLYVFGNDILALAAGGAGK